MTATDTRGAPTPPRASATAPRSIEAGRAGAALPSASSDAWPSRSPSRPFLVAAVALLVTVGGDYQPVSDQRSPSCRCAAWGATRCCSAWYSRGDWNHPGPAGSTCWRRSTG